jgi:hypothetical protein
VKTVLALIFALLPLIAYGSGKPPPLVKETVYVNQDCRHCKRDRVGWFLLGVGTGVVLYESGGADKAKQWLRVKPAQSGAMLTYEREF